MQEIFKSHRSTRSLLHLSLHITCQRKISINHLKINGRPSVQQMKNEAELQEVSMRAQQCCHYRLLQNLKIPLAQQHMCLGRFKNSCLSKHSSFPKSRINVEELLNTENHKAGNFSIYPDDNSFIKGWGTLTMFFKEKPQGVHQIWRSSYIYP